uniref:Uncharacterized protein n=1 Tax=Rhipicephalus zambeziensis TaxID=60191 RepID=A0A224YH74_9ACAR
MEKTCSYEQQPMLALNYTGNVLSHHTGTISDTHRLVIVLNADIVTYASSQLVHQHGARLATGIIDFNLLVTSKRLPVFTVCLHFLLSLMPRACKHRMSLKIGTFKKKETTVAAT